MVEEDPLTNSLHIHRCQGSEEGSNRAARKKGSRLSAKHSLRNVTEHGLALPLFRVVDTSAGNVEHRPLHLELVAAGLVAHTAAGKEFPQFSFKNEEVPLNPRVHFVVVAANCGTCLV